MTRALWILGFVWALPITLLGLLLAAITCDRFEGMFEGAWIFRARRWWTLAFFNRLHVGAYTWGGTIHLPADGPINMAVIHHELVHFKQARIFGPFMPLAYGVGALWAVAHGRRAYVDNPLEIWARNEAGR